MKMSSKSSNEILWGSGLVAYSFPDAAAVLLLILLYYCSRTIQDGLISEQLGGDAVLQEMQCFGCYSAQLLYIFLKNVVL